MEDLPDNTKIVNWLVHLSWFLLHWCHDILVFMAKHWIAYHMVYYYHDDHHCQLLVISLQKPTWRKLTDQVTPQNPDFFISINFPNIIRSSLFILIGPDESKRIGMHVLHIYWRFFKIWWSSHSSTITWSLALPNKLHKDMNFHHYCLSVSKSILSFMSLSDWLKIAQQAPLLHS